MTTTLVGKSSRRSLALLLSLAVAVAVGAGGCKKTSTPASPESVPPAPGTKAPAPVGGPASEESGAPPAAGDGAIAGEIVLADALKGKVTEGDVILAMARKKEVRFPVAVQKLRVSKFPMAFSISGKDAMMPGMPFKGPMDIAIRVDKDGEAMTTKKGDVTGQLVGVMEGTSGLKLVLDTLVDKDVIKGGRPKAPAGHP